MRDPLTLQGKGGRGTERETKNTSLPSSFFPLTVPQREREKEDSHFGARNVLSHRHKKRGSLENLERRLFSSRYGWKNNRGGLFSSLGGGRSWLGWGGRVLSSGWAGCEGKGRVGSSSLSPSLVDAPFFGSPGKGWGRKDLGFSSVERQGTSLRKVRTEKHLPILVISYIFVESLDFWWGDRRSSFAPPSEFIPRLMGHAQKTEGGGDVSRSERSILFSRLKNVRPNKTPKVARKKS